MRQAVRWIALFTCYVLFIAVLFPPAHAQAFTVLHYFTGGADGANPHAGLTMDLHGNLYGTTTTGGPAGFGTVFQMKPAGTGWILNPLHAFTGDSDGGNPWARVVLGPDGTLYGTTTVGGDLSCIIEGSYGCGTVFNLRPPPTICRSVSCPWILTTLYTFTDPASNGGFPLGDLAFDRAGNIYGTTLAGGNIASQCSDPFWISDGCGVVFELSHTNGGWTYSVLYRFSGMDGGQPAAGVTLDAESNIYGTTLSGGNSVGVVYELSPSGSGWVESNLYSLLCGGSSGCYPAADVILDTAGDVFGTAQFDGGRGYGKGTVFELSSAPWNLVKAYTFSCCAQNPGPQAGATMDSAGNLYGTDASAGNFGTVFGLTPSFGYTLLHQFTGYDGANPMSIVTIDAQGNLYGTATDTYAPYWGTVWKITP